MRYEDIKVVVVISICFGCFVLLIQISNLCYENIWSTMFMGYIFVIIETILLFIAIPILYLRHLNKI